MILFAAIEKAGSAEPMKIVEAMEGLEVTSVKGPVLMRKCDHQGENQGFVVKVAKTDKFAEPVGEIIKIYPREHDDAGLPQRQLPQPVTSGQRAARLHGGPSRRRAACSQDIR